MSLTNAGFNILSYYVEEENLSRAIRGLWVDSTITDDVVKPQCIFCSKVPGNVLMKPSICKVASLHPTHDMTTTYLCRPTALNFVL